MAKYLVALSAAGLNTGSQGTHLLFCKAKAVQAGDVLLNQTWPILFQKEILAFRQKVKDFNLDLLLVGAAIVINQLNILPINI